MRRAFTLAVASCSVMVAAATAQTPSSSPASASRSPVELVGCVSHDPGTSGSLTVSETAGVGRYRLTGKSVRQYAGRKVRVVGGPEDKGKRLSIRGGLWPSPNIAAGAMDPAQASVARQPGGAAAGAGNYLPEFRVVSVRRV